MHVGGMRVRALCSISRVLALGLASRGPLSLMAIRLSLSLLRSLADLHRAWVLPGITPQSSVAKREREKGSKLILKLLTQLVGPLAQTRLAFYTPTGWLASGSP